VEEHDQEFVNEPGTGGQWSVVETDAGLEFEQVSPPTEE
jgi:hypothetical protein